VNFERLKRRYQVRGVFWREFQDWAVLNLPFFIEPFQMAAWTLIFFLVARRERRAVIQNLRMIHPGTSWIAAWFRAYRVFWNFSWTTTDTARFKLTRQTMDWDFDGLEYFHQLMATRTGAIILTAHMGNYDLGAFLFSQKGGRTITVIRAPESDPDTQQYVERKSDATDGFRVGYSQSDSMLGIDLIHAIQNREIVAIQGDRLVPGISSIESSLFTHRTLLPSGPFALAMATGAAIFPLFVVRLGRRRYRLVHRPPFYCKRTGPDRARDFREATSQWTSVLEEIVGAYSYQWYVFEPFAAPERPGAQ